MRTPFRFPGWSRAFRLASPVLSLAAILSGSMAAWAGDTPSSAVGRIEGKDVSVEDGIRTSADASQGIDVANGNVVTVHSGKARMTLFAGGKVEICGPAKFTVLLSGNAITLALSFGRVRAELPVNTSLRIFTPTIVGTPLDISGGARDVTVGLTIDDSLCVLATSGAVQLEHQFSGEKIIVPQAGEFFLNAGQLLPVAGTPGTCQCLADEHDAAPAPTVPEFAAVAPAAVGPQPPSAARPAVAVPAPVLPELRVQPEPEPVPGLQYSVLQHANQGHPLAASAKLGNLAAPPSSFVSQISEVPALVFSSTTPLPPPGPSPDAVLLIREAQVSPEWQFSGHVEAPEFAAAMQHALGERPLTSSQPPPAGAQTPAQPKKNKGGFWAALKRAFGGG
jgi:hypothetical protein